MSGLLVILLLIAWAYVCSLIATSLTKNIKFLRWIASPLLFVCFFVLPLADEILTRTTFYSLCNSDAKLQINETKANGKTVRLNKISSQTKATFFSPVVIRQTHFSLIDTKSGETLGTYGVFQMDGGALARVLSFPDGGRPWTGDASCSPPLSAHTYAKMYGFTLIN